jgi:hypothetical protein
MGYWRSVGRRAWREAAKSVGLETTERIIVALIIQCVIAIAIFGALGQTGLQDALGTRIATAAVPFLILPFVFLVKFISLPPRIDAELRSERHGLESTSDAGIAETLPRFRIASELRSGRDGPESKNNAGIAETHPRFRIDSELRSELHGLESKSSAGIAETHPRLTIPRLIAKPRQQGYQIEVENAGADHLENCLVKVTSIEGVNRIYEVLMPLVLMTGGQANGGDSGSFNLRPGERKPVGLITEAHGKLRIFCEGSGFEDFSFMKECIVHVTAFGPPTPRHAKIHVVMADGNQLRATLLAN